MSPSRIEATLTASSQRREDPKKLAAAASDFEALLLSQLMKSAREAASPSSDGEAGGSCDSIMELAEQQFGQILASAGGLGIAKLAVSGLTPKDTGAAAKDRR